MFFSIPKIPLIVYNFDIWQHFRIIEMNDSENWLN